MEELNESTAPRSQVLARLCLGLVCLSFVVGILLRYQFICVENRPSDPANILGDAGWYVYEAVHFFEPDFRPNLFDTLYPPGTPIYFALLRAIDPSMRVLDLMQWFLSCLVPLLLFSLARQLFSKQAALFVLAFSSLYFPLWEYFGYFLSEGPFLVTLFSTFFLLVMSLRSPSRFVAIALGFFAGLMLGLSASFKSCVLFSALLVALGLLWGRRKSQLRLVPSFFAAALGLVAVLLPMSIRATRLNEGNFLLIANDAHRTFLLGHQGRVGLTWFYDDKRNFHQNFINPNSNQHNYAEQRTYRFGPYEAAPNYAAGWDWIRRNPGEAFLLSLEHVFDLFAIALPWPGYFRSYARWTSFFNQVFMALILLPALLHLFRSRRELWEARPELLGDLIVALAGCSIYILAFFFLGEGRYRIMYDGFLILLAARAFFPRTQNMHPLSPGSTD